LKVRPGGREGDAALISVIPAAEYPILVNDVTTVKKGTETNLKIKREEAPNRLRIMGMVGLNDKEADLSIAVRNPALFGGYVFKKTLSERGIVVAGDVRTTQKMPHSLTSENRLLAGHSSPPLVDIVTVINKESKNLPAELLFLTVGHEYNGKGNGESAALALKASLERHVKSGSDEPLLLFDGSGLSRYNLVSPKQVVALLTFMAKNEHFSSFYNSLSVAGVDGSLRRQMLGTSCEGNLRGKTGTLRMIRNLSGYVQTTDGDLVAFSFMSNFYGGKVDDINGLYRRLCSIIVSKPQTGNR
jgi:serine-type D-Ala-D-Ala carboxypeptidase/endopeptidase (penicillin-binding protein 4)